MKRGGKGRVWFRKAPMESPSPLPPHTHTYKTSLCDGPRHTHTDYLSVWLPSCHFFLSLPSFVLLLFSCQDAFFSYVLSFLPHRCFQSCLIPDKTVCFQMNLLTWFLLSQLILLFMFSPTNAHSFSYIVKWEFLQNNHHSEKDFDAAVLETLILDSSSCDAVFWIL